MRVRVLAVPFAALVFNACHHENLVEPSVAQVDPLRAGVIVTHGGADTISQARRLAAGDTVRTDATGRATLALDAGARYDLDHATNVRVTGARSATLEDGRLWIAAPEQAARADETLLTAGSLVLHLRGSRASIERHGGNAQITVLAGEVAYESDRERGSVRAGDSMRVAGGAVTIAHDAVFDDWTGGLADEAGTAGGEAAGLGAVAARRPDEAGSPRWPMVMQRLDAHVVVRGDLAITTIDQTFFNPSAYTVEGIYSFSAPAGAVLQSFAVDRRGRTVEGVVRERQQAAAQYQAQVYEGSTHDPALLEWDAPGRYHARLYPIPAAATRRVRVKYSQWLMPDAQGHRTYRLPLASLDTRIGELRADVDLDDANVTTVRTVNGARIDDHHVLIAQSDVLPRADLVLEMQGVARQAASAVTARIGGDDRGNLLRVTIPVPVEAASAARDEGLDLVVLVDHSAGTDAVARRLEQAFVEAIVRQLDPRDRILVLAGDVATRPLGTTVAELRNATPEQRRALIDALSHDAFGGATDLSAMIAAAHRALRPDRNGAIVYVGDGEATVGERELPALRQMLTRLSPRPRFYAVAVGEEPRLDLLTGLAEPAGFAARVARRADVARTALDLLAHAGRPLVRNVRVDLGPDAQSVYPADPVDLPAGEPMVVTARVMGDVPRTATVHAMWNGREVSRSITIDPQAIEDDGDLRARWATMRLEHLLARGESRPVIVELGMRFHLITPFTSFYVASEDEVVSMETRERAARDRHARVASLNDLSPLDFVPLIGCSRMRESAPASEAVPASAPSPATQEEQQGGTGTRHAGPEGRMGARATSGSTSGQYAVRQGGEADQREAQVQALAARVAPTAGLGAIGHGSGGGGSEGYGGAVAANAAPAAAPAEVEAPAPQPTTPTLADSTADMPTRAYRGAAHHAAGGARRTRNNEGGRDESNVDVVSNDGLRAGTFDLDGEDRAAATATTTSAPRPSNTPRAAAAPALTASRCSEAAASSLTDRIPLWRERLAGHHAAYEVASIYRDARQACELPAQADRAALLRLMTDAVGALDAQIALYRAVDRDGAARAWLRANILRALARTGDLARAESLGLGRLNPSEMATALAGAATLEARLAILRELSRRYPDDSDLALRYLDAAVESRAADDVHAVARRLRDDPQSDARTRTAVGEALLTVGDDAEARRAFSEIVEFAPDDPLARRRLGDIALSHGWADEAYRQFQVLAQVEHDAADVLLREAMAARLAGRIDEAIRLAERVAQMSSGGAGASIPDTAAAWIGVELALAAQEPGAAREQVEALRARWRRSAAARAAGAMRVVLRWAHPDDGAELWITLPDEGTRRGDMLAGAMFFESTVFTDVPQGLHLEVRRAEGTRPHGEAELIVLWNEGTPNEHITRTRVPLDEAHSVQRFDVNGTDLVAVTAPAATGPIARAERVLSGGAR